jgi:hypothetical protein
MEELGKLTARSTVVAEKQNSVSENYTSLDFLLRQHEYSYTLIILHKDPF